MLKYIVGVLVFGLVQANCAIADEPVGFLEDIRRGSSRVSGGWPAEDGQFPYQAGIRTVNVNGLVIACGGFIIHHDWIMTAAHCLAHRPSYIIRLGSVDLHHPLFMLEQSLSDAIFYPDFNMETANRVQRHDIAVIRLSLSIPYGPTIQPARIQNSLQKDINYDGKIVAVSGFGFDHDSWAGGAASDYLLWVYLRAISNEECQTFYNSVFPSTICAGYYNETIQNACHGDSGGPLTIVDEDGGATVVGIVHYASWRGCSSYWPTAYVRPGFYHDWLNEVTEIDFDWDLPNIPEENSEDS